MAEEKKQGTDTSLPENVYIGVDHASPYPGDSTSVVIAEKHNDGGVTVHAIVEEPTLLRVLDAMRVNLDPVQREALRKLEKGSVLTVWDVSGVAAQRFKGDIQSNDPRMAITTGNIAEDILMFMRVEFPRIVNSVLTQSFADDLFIFLRKRGWEDEDIIPNLQRAVDAYKNSLKPKPPKVDGVVVNSVQSIELPVDPKGGTSTIQVGGMKWEQGKHYDIVWEGEGENLKGTIMWYPDAPRVECCSTCGLPKNPITVNCMGFTLWGKCANPECPAFGEKLASASYRFPGDFTGSPADVTEQKPINVGETQRVPGKSGVCPKCFSHTFGPICSDCGEPTLGFEPGADVGGEATLGASSGETPQPSGDEPIPNALVEARREAWEAADVSHFVLSFVKRCDCCDWFERVELSGKRGDGPQIILRSYCENPYCDTGLLINEDFEYAVGDPVFVRVRKGKQSDIRREGVIHEIRKSDTEGENFEYTVRGYSGDILFPFPGSSPWLSYHELRPQGFEAFKDRNGVLLEPYRED